MVNAFRFGSGAVRSGFGGVQLFVALENPAAIAPARLLLVGTMHAGAHKARAPEIGGAEIGITEIGVGQVAVAEITACRAAALEHALIQARTAEVGGIQRRFAEDRLIELPAAALRVGQIGLQPQRLLRLHARQVGAPQRSALEVALTQRRWLKSTSSSWLSVNWQATRRCPA